MRTIEYLQFQFEHRIWAGRFHSCASICKTASGLGRRSARPAVQLGARMEPNARNFNENIRHPWACYGQWIESNLCVRAQLRRSAAVSAESSRSLQKPRNMSLPPSNLTGKTMPSHGGIQDLCGERLKVFYKWHGASGLISSPKEAAFSDTTCS